MARNTFLVVLVLLVLAGTFLGANGRRRNGRNKGGKKNREWQVISKNDEVVRQVTVYGLSEVNRLNLGNSSMKYQLTRIKKAKLKPIGESRYDILVIAQETDCPIDAPDEEKCEINRSGKKQRCQLVVDYKPSDGSMVLKEDEINCKQQSKKNKKNKRKNNNRKKNNRKKNKPKKNKPKKNKPKKNKPKKNKPKKNKPKKNKPKKNRRKENRRKKNKGRRKRDREREAENEDIGEDMEERRKRSIDEDPLRGTPKYKMITPMFPYYDDFESFRIKFNRPYKQHSDEYNLRYEIFEENMEQVKLLNRYERGTAKYGATKFADVSKEEFKQYYLGLKQPVEDPTLKPAKIPAFKAPDAFDWRDKGAVTEVKDQGTCGSSWVFSTTGNIEGQLKIQKGALVSLSEQELVDCDKIDEGCNGGLPTHAYQEIMRLGGLVSEVDYAYKGHYSDKCEFDKSKIKVSISGAVNISKDEGEMASWLATYGPISIGMNANAMQFYLGGISYPFKFLCNPDNLGHGALIVGYGVEGDKPYWIIKNSWGADWGEKGYYLVYRGAGVCGLNQMCTSAVVH